MKGRILKIIISLSLIICIGLFGVVMSGCNYNELPELPPENQEPTDNDYVLPDNQEPTDNEVDLEIISQQHDQLIKSYARMPTLDDDFDDDEITIILDGEHSGTGIGNSRYNFDEVIAELKKVDNIDINSVEELFKPKEGVPVLATYRRMFFVKLKTPGKDKIIEAIKQLQELDMVLAAEPKYNRYAVND